MSEYAFQVRRREEAMQKLKFQNMDFQEQVSSKEEKVAQLERSLQQTEAESQTLKSEVNVQSHS